jgi:hypothetical protein
MSLNESYWLNNRENIRFWLAGSFLLTFCIWLYLVFFQISTKVDALKVQTGNVSKDSIINLSAPILHLYIKLNSVVKKGDSLGLKVDYKTWKAIEDLEELINHEENPQALLAKLNIVEVENKEIKDQKELLIKRLEKIMLTGTITHEVKQVKKLSPAKTDNTKIIQAAQLELKKLQGQYAKKEISLEKLISASNRLKDLKSENGKSISINNEQAIQAIEQEKQLEITIDEEYKQLIESLKEKIYEWKSAQVITSPDSGTLEFNKFPAENNYFIKVNSTTPYYFVIPEKANTPDTLNGIIILRDKSKLSVKAIRLNTSNHFIINKDSIIKDQYKFNKNARLFFNTTGLSYYSRLKNLLHYK